MNMYVIIGERLDNETFWLKKPPDWEDLNRQPLGPEPTAYYVAIVLYCIKGLLTLLINYFRPSLNVILGSIPEAKVMKLKQKRFQIA